MVTYNETTIKKQTDKNWNKALDVAKYKNLWKTLKDYPMYVVNIVVQL